VLPFSILVNITWLVVWSPVAFPPPPGFPPPVAIVVIIFIMVSIILVLHLLLLLLLFLLWWWWCLLVSGMVVGWQLLLLVLLPEGVGQKYILCCTDLLNSLTQSTMLMNVFYILAQHPVIFTEYERTWIDGWCITVCSAHFL
jgi:hypothetical protein